MEGMEMKNLFESVYDRKKVFLTGHTGFKGSWLAFWLKQMGAEVRGYSKDIPSAPNHYQLLNLNIKSEIGNICDFNKLKSCISGFKPDIIFHLAAQPLVRYSYQNPLETFNSNVIGTVNVFEAARSCETVKAIVNITSDKAYENIEQDVAYKETDRMGGYDPYSASKGCAELVVSSYRNSFLNLDTYGKKHKLLLASARAGNVIGGGDWAEDRLIPDIVKASINAEPVVIRNPAAVRPWQHVLEPLSGYLLLGQLLMQGRLDVADGWNFGPATNETLQVQEVLQKMKKVWSNLQYKIDKSSNQPHEATLLRLDCTKANEKLNWFPVWDMETAIYKTADWYRQYCFSKLLLSNDDLENYVRDAENKSICWAKL